MKKDTLEMLSDFILPQVKDGKVFTSPVQIQKVADKTFYYSERHRGNWHKPEYDFREIQIAESRDGYIGRSISKRVNRMIVAGFSFTGDNAEAVYYIQRRLEGTMAWATGRPFSSLIWGTIQDLCRFNNCAWVKSRDSDKSEGKVRTDVAGTELDPVAGYFILPFETLEFKTKANGELKKVLQKMPSGRYKEYFPRDIILFSTNRKPGFTIGTPELLPAIDDIALLRRVEENIEDLIETELFPTYHWKVGTEESPERVTPEGVTETDVLNKKIEYMPAGGVFVTDHRHEILVVGAEGEALKIDPYLLHLKNRALASCGTSALDMGEGTGATKSTASTLSKGMLLDIEALAIQVEAMIDFYVINELLIEGGFDPFNGEDDVHLKFGIIDKEERRADENQQIQLFSGNMRTMDEVRSSLGDVPFEEDMLDRTHHKMFAEPTALLKGMGPGTAASEALARSPSSNIEESDINKERKYNEQLEKQKLAVKKAAQKGRPATKKNGTSANKARPANQHKTRSSPKTNRDVVFSNGETILLDCKEGISDVTIEAWKDSVWKRYSSMNGKVSLGTIADSMLWRLNE